jgi:DHA1 family tetracycline resistance protein-like MFS transporter
VALRRVTLPEPWFTPFALVNGGALGVTPILLPVAAARSGLGHVGLVMGAFNLGAFAAPLVGSLADRLRAHRLLAAGCAAVAALALALFPLAGPALQVLLGLGDGAGFAGAMTIASLLIVERRPRAEWNQRLALLESALSVGQGAALLFSSWLSGLSPRTGLLLGALVPAAAVPLALLLVPRTPAAAPPHARAAHQLDSNGQVGEWGPASPSRAHQFARRRRPSLTAVLRGPLGWLLAAWIPAYAGSAIIFALYPVLFQNAFGIDPTTSALAFAVIVFVSLPLFLLAGRVSQRHGPARVIAAAFGARLILLTALAALAAAGHVPAIAPLAAFAGIMFAWSFLSVASPGLTGQLRPDAEGDAQGLLNASSGLAGLLGSVAGGFVAGHWGYPAALGAGAAGTLAGLAILALTLLRRAPAAPAARPG